MPDDDPELTADEAFEQVFWPEYPRKIAKVKALKAWRALHLKNNDQEALDAIMAGLERACKRWNIKEKEFIPYAATWINGRRWEDEE